MEQTFIGYPAAGLPKDVWGQILQNLGIFELVFMRATNSTFYNWCKEYKPFPKYFVLDQDKFTEYLVENGFISCLDYVKNVLNFELTDKLCSVAARSGQVEMLKYLRNQRLAIDPNKIILECTQGTCNIDMVKYLHETGAIWGEVRNNRLSYSETAMENMARHGHLSCMKYAMENGCTQRVIPYTPSIECLEFAIQNEFEWNAIQILSPRVGTRSPPKLKNNICEEAARFGNFTMLQYAHQHGVPLKNSASLAAQAGHLDCLVYATNPLPIGADLPNGAATMECFKYLLDKYPKRNTTVMWRYQIQIGNMEILRFMLENKFPLPDDRELLAWATKFEVFKFLVDELKVPCHSFNPYSRFAKEGNLDGLKFAFERNLPLYASQPSFVPIRPSSIINEIICNAIQSKNVEVLKLVWEKIMPKDEVVNDQWCNYAVTSSTPEILDFLKQKGAKWTSKHLTTASESSNLQNMAYLTHIGCQWNDAACIKTSAMCVKYTQQHGCTISRYPVLVKPIGAAPNSGPDYQDCS